MKVTHLLGKTPWVETRRGRGGGMRLIVEPRALRIGDAVQFLEGNFGLAECLQPDGRCCLSRGCGLISVLLGASDAFVASLNRYTLADVLATSPALQQLSFVPMSQIRAAAEAP
jgi:Rrf2 family transcriptional regulator, nitric oxide-sensitive transcriptional repressor